MKTIRTICDQCGKEINATNTFHINYHGEQRMTLCGKHYAQYIKFKHFLDNDQRTIFTENTYEIFGDSVYIYTYNKKQKVSGRFLIDLEDLEKVIVHKWRHWKGQYMTGNMRPISIYRFLLQPKPLEVVDHINGDPSDNRKCNLRITQQNKNLLNKALQSNNKTGVCGVWLRKDRNTWCAEIRINDIRCYIGEYKEFKNAVYARYYGECRLFQEFRSFRNDDHLNDIIKDCDETEKEKIRKYVDKRFKIIYKI